MRRALKIVAALLLLVATGAVALVALLPTERIAALVAERVEAATGRALTLEGGLSPSFWPVLGVETGAFSLANAEWGAAPALVSAKGARIGVEVMPLLSGEIRVREVRLVEPVIALEIGADGAANWDFGGPGAPEGASGESAALTAFSLDEAVIEGGALRFSDARTGEIHSVEAADLRAALPEGLEGALTLAGEATWRGEAARIDLELASPGAAMRGERIALRLDFEGAGASLFYDGEADPSGPAAAGALKLSAADPAALLALAGIAPPPAAAGLSDVTLEGRVDIGPALSVDLKGGATKAGERGVFTLIAEAPPGWEESLTADLDLTAEIGSLARIAWKGRAGPGAGGAPAALDGTFALEAADPAKAAAFALGEAPAQLAGLSNVALEGRIAMGEALSLAATGGATKAGERAEIALSAEAAPGWTQSLTADVDLSAKIGSLARVSYKGLAGPGSGAAPVTLKGDYALAAADPAKAVAFALGEAPAQLAGLSGLDLSGRIDLSAAGLSGAAKGGVARDGRRATVDLTARGGADWATARAFALKLDASLEGLARLSFDGRAAAPDGAAPSVEGALDLDAPDLRGLAAFAGAALPEGQPGAFRRLRVTGDVTTPAPSQIRIATSRLDFDDISAKGPIRLAYGGKPVLSAVLEAGALDLTPYIGGGEAGPSGPGWSKERIDLSGLNALDADVTLRAASVTLPNMRLGRSDVTAKLAGGRLDLSVKELGFYEGGVQGVVRLDAARGVALDADVTASAVRLLPMLRDLADVTNLEGLGRVNFAVSGAGESLDAIMRSLDGNGAISLTDGALVGFNLAAMVRNLTGGGGEQKTDFSEISGTFTIRDGVLSNGDFAFLGPLIRITGEGTADLGAQTANFRLVPKAVATLKGQGGGLDRSGLSFPLIISGPWANLSIRPDLQAGIEALLTDPEGVLDAAKGLIEGGGAGAIQGAVGAALGGAAVGGAAKALEAAKENPAAAAAEALRAITGAPAAEPAPKPDLSGLTKEERQAERKRLRQEERRAKRAEERRQEQLRNDPAGAVVNELLNQIRKP